MSTTFACIAFIATAFMAFIAITLDKNLDNESGDGSNKSQGSRVRVDHHCLENIRRDNKIELCIQTLRAFRESLCVCVLVCLCVWVPERLLERNLKSNSMRKGDVREELRGWSERSDLFCKPHSSGSNTDTADKPEELGPFQQEMKPLSQLAIAAWTVASDDALLRRHPALANLCLLS